MLSLIVTVRLSTGFLVLLWKNKRRVITSLTLGIINDRQIIADFFLVKPHLERLRFCPQPANSATQSQSQYNFLHLPSSSRDIVSQFCSCQSI